MKHKKNLINIIYICTADKGPSGGAKTIYNHSYAINKLNIEDISSEILHIKKKKISKWNNSLKKIFKIDNNKFFGWTANDISICKNFKSKWFKNNIKLRKDFLFDKEKDFVIFPEIFSQFAKELCIKNNVPYAIFVQNGYSLNSTNDYKTLEDVYKYAKFILSYSNDISKCVKLAFHKGSNKILRTNISVDAKKFNFKTKKNNLITYMPRKLPTHSDNLVFFLRNSLPKSWKFKSLHNLSENEVYKYLLKSKIFLSFSNMEGLGMPPIEAAIAGNKIIGYPGQGGKQYWKEPLFTEIPHGNISRFIDKIFENIKKKDSIMKIRMVRKKIINQFSVEQEKKHLIKMIKKITSSR